MAVSVEHHSDTEGRQLWLMTRLWSDMVQSHLSYFNFKRKSGVRQDAVPSDTVWQAHQWGHFNLQTSVSSCQLCLDDKHTFSVPLWLICMFHADSHCIMTSFAREGGLLCNYSISHKCYWWSGWKWMVLSLLPAIWLTWEGSLSYRTVHKVVFSAAWNYMDEC